MHLERCAVSDIHTFIASHYLRKRPAVVTLCLAAMDPHPVGVVVFALPPKQTAVRYGGLTWELARLYLMDECAPNSETKIISMAVRFIRFQFPEVRFLVSYADPSAGHSGTIYRAAGWKSDGRTDDERKTPRFDYHAEDDAWFSDGVRYSRKAHVPKGCSTAWVPRVSKFRFVLALHP